MRDLSAKDPAYAATFAAALLGQPLPGPIARAIPAPLHVVDIGALGTEEREVYEPLCLYHPVSAIGFEPQATAQETARLKQMTRTVLPVALGDGAPAPLHRTRFRACSSTRPPDAALLSAYHALPEMLTVEDVDMVPTVRLDDVSEIADCDLLKIDVQGAELDVLRHGERVLGGATVVIAEVEFIPLYKGQPLFADVDSFLRGLGFDFLDFLTFGGAAWRAAPFGDHMGRTTWADAVYVAGDKRLDALGPAKRLKAFLIAHHVLRNSGYAAHLLKIADAAADAGEPLSPHYTPMLHYAHYLAMRALGRPLPPVE